MTDTIAIDPAILLDELRAEIRALSERVARLEAPVAAAPPPPAAAPEFLAEPVPEAISEEILLVIAAAVAAFLGERAHIRQVRLLRSPAWAQQGRVTIQASHQLQH